MRFAVIQFGGSNCDRDVAYVLNEVCGIDTDLLWYKEGLSRAYDAVVLPGGFSYGDYLRAGAIAARTRVMDDVRRLAASGGLVLGICNGAQILAESGLVPGVFTVNAYPKFICKPAYLRVERSDTPFICSMRQATSSRYPLPTEKGGIFHLPREGGMSEESREILSRSGSVMRMGMRLPKATRTAPTRISPEFSLWAETSSR